MRTLITGNGINIQFGGYSNTNESILIRAIKSVKENDFPKNIITQDTNDILILIGTLFLEIQEILKGNDDKYTICNDERVSLDDFKKRYKNRKNLRLTDVGFEDYYLIYDLLCNKNRLENPDKYYAREALKMFFLHSIYYKGSVNNIYKNYPNSLKEFFKQFNNIFTTNYDKNIELFTNKEVYYLHGAFHIKDHKYNPENLRNKLSDEPLKDFKLDENYYYLYSNVLTSYSGFSKEFVIKQNILANECLEKMANGYFEHPETQADIESWKDSKNLLVRNMYESIKLKIKNPDLKFEVQYPIKEFDDIEGEFDIVGLSPNNDTHIFKAINDNNKLTSGAYYYYDKSEVKIVKRLLNNINMTYIDVKKLWKQYE